MDEEEIKIYMQKLINGELKQTEIATKVRDALLREEILEALFFNGLLRLTMGSILGFSNRFLRLRGIGEPENSAQHFVYILFYGVPWQTNLQMQREYAFVPYKFWEQHIALPMQGKSLGQALRVRLNIEDVDVQLVKRLLAKTLSEAR